MQRVPRSIGERRVFIDTSAFLALIARNDSQHISATTTFERLRIGSFQPVSTKFVIVESHAAILATVGPDAAREFLRGMAQSATSLIRTLPADEDRALEIIFTYRDKEYSLCDALSFALMERLGIRLAFAYDDHFRQHGFLIPHSDRPWP